MFFTYKIDGFMENFKNTYFLQLFRNYNTDSVLYKNSQA